METLTWMIQTFGGMAGLIASVVLLVDRFRSRPPTVSIQAIELHDGVSAGFPSVVAVVNNPGKRSILISADPTKSDLIVAFDKDETKHVVEQIMGGSSRAALAPAASATFELTLKQKTRALPADAELTLALSWQPIEFRRGRPRPRTLETKVARRDYYDLLKKPLDHNEA